MIKKSVFEDELIAGMQRELQPFEKKAATTDLVKAADYLHSALEIFEEAGMTAKADQVLRILAKIAHESEGMDKIKEMLEDAIEAHESSGGEPLDLKSFKPLSVEERMLLEPKEPELLEVDDNDTSGKKDKDFYQKVMKWIENPDTPMEEESAVPETIEFKSLMEPQALPPGGEELVFKSIAQELGLDDNDAKPRKPKDPTKVHSPTTEQQVKNLKNHGTVFNMADDGFAGDLLNLEISENPIEVTDPSEGKTFEDSD
jgi:hypothetical protein